MSKEVFQAVKILGDLVDALHHQVHVPGCKCRTAIRKLRHAMAHLLAVHWAGMKPGGCTRKDSGVDVVTTTYATGAIAYVAVASHYGNITCLVCRKAAWKAGVR